MKTLAQAPRKRGFTLIELLVAMTITTLIVSILVAITSVSIDAWQRSRSEVRASRQAKSMVDALAKDFEAMVMRRGNTFEWLYANTPGTLPGPTSMPSTNASELIFFSHATDRYNGKINDQTEDKGGDVSCVSYQLAYQDPVMGDTATGSAAYPTFVLYRLLVNPDETFTTLLGKDDLKQAFTNFQANQNKPENFVCENVFQFTMKFQVEVQKQTGSGSNATIQKVQVPVVMGSATSASRAETINFRGNNLKVTPPPASASVTPAELQAGRISAVEISLTVVTDFGLNQLATRTFKTDDERAQFLAKNSYEFSKLVEIPGT